MYQTFNMGVGLTIVTDDPKNITASLNKMGEKYWVLGKTQRGSERIILKNNDIVLN